MKAPVWLTVTFTVSSAASGAVRVRVNSAGPFSSDIGVDAGAMVTSGSLARIVIVAVLALPSVAFVRLLSVAVKSSSPSRSMSLVTSTVEQNFCCRGKSLPCAFSAV